MKKAQGITLIALVVTIVTMLILAAVSINISFGENGIFTQASRGSLQYRTEEVKEKITFEMSGLVTEAVVTKNPLTAEKIVDHFEGLDWVGSATKESEDTVRIISTDRIIVDIEFTPFNGFEMIEQGLDDGEPYPNIQVEQLPTEGVAGEKIKIKVTASVEVRGETTGIATVENVTTGDTKEYTEGGVIFEVTDNGEYTFKATTNKGKTKLAKINIHIATGGVIGITIQPTTPRNTIKEGNQNGVATGPITVSISYGEIELSNRDKYQYRIGKEGSWQTANSNQINVKVDENTIVVARYYDGMNSIGVQNYSIQNVDNVAPTGVTGNITNATTNSLTIEANASDTASSGAGSDIAGILRYEYSMNGTDWQTENTIQRLNHNTEYTIQIKAIDKAGNETIGSVTGKTVEVPGGNAIGFNASATTWTKGPVTVEITWPNNTAGLTRKYKIGNGDWQDYTATISISTNTTVYAMLVDGNGQSGATAEYAITWIDNVTPKAPTLAVTNGIAGSNGWYRSNVTVTITNGTDSFGEVDRTVYVITGAQTLGETAGNTATISSEGTSTITAYTYDKAGNRSQGASISVKKDSIGPTVNLTVGTKTNNSITVNVSASDAFSNLASYTYYLNNNQVNTGASSSYTYSGLKAGTSYTLRVDVMDQAGNTASKSLTESTTGVDWRLSYYSNGAKATLRNPSSSSNPTIFEIPSVSQQEFGVSIYATYPLKVGDVVEVTYTSSRSGSNYLNFFIQTMEDMQYRMTGAYTTSTPQKLTLTANTASTNWRVGLDKTDSTSSSIYGIVYIHDIKVNGEKIL